MTIVFRTSTFFLVVVISLKTFSVMGSNLADTRTSGFEHRVEQLLNESLRHRKELDDVAEEGSNMAQALYSIANRSIRRGSQVVIRALGHVVRPAKIVSSVLTSMANRMDSAYSAKGTHYGLPFDGKQGNSLWPNWLGKEVAC